MNEKTLRILVVILGLSLCYSIVMWGKKDSQVKEKQKELDNISKKVDSLQNYSDSIYMELFPSQIELGRYQVAFEIFMSRNPKAAEQYGTIISEETE